MEGPNSMESEVRVAMKGESAGKGDVLYIVDIDEASSLIQLPFN